MKEYRHRLDGEFVSLPVGKVVCVGRNYAEHARELNNPIEAEPLLFMKAANACVSLEEPFSLPRDRGICHFETEMAVLVGKRLRIADLDSVRDAIAGVGVALDLTLRDVQQELKTKGLPWEKAKAFDGACPLSGYTRFDGDLQSVSIRLTRNGVLAQNGNTSDMLTPTLELIAYISQQFTLMPGDVVLTGTPAGVGPLEPGDCLKIELGDLIAVDTTAV